MPHLEGDPTSHLPRLMVISVAALILAGGPVGGARAADPVIAAAGDIACDPGNADFNNGRGTANHCRQRYTSDLLVNSGLTRVLALGDLQYESGSYADFLASYDRSWGRVKSITRPVLGNHEEEGTGYFDYFNGKRERYGPAGERGKGYYSFDVGRWHLVALNSNCSMVSCSRGSAQERWLRADLAASRSSCTLAYWHHPRFTSWQPPDSNAMQAIWQVLYDAGAEVVLSGHSHHYERFAPQDAGAKLDRANGIRQFVVGGAGAFFTTLGTPRPNSELRNNRTFGVLKLTLHPTSYDWRFVPEAGKSFTDAGSELCHGGELAADYSAPGEPEDLTARPAGPLSVDLDWGAAVDNVAVTGYELFRDDELLAATASTSFSDTTIGRSATYSYRVRALDAAGNRSRFSNEVRVTISASGAVTIDSSPVDVRVGIPGGRRRSRPPPPHWAGAPPFGWRGSCSRGSSGASSPSAGPSGARVRARRVTRYCRVTWRYHGSSYAGRIALARERSIVAWRYRIIRRPHFRRARVLRARGRYLL